MTAAAAFKGIALFVWSRHRLLIVGSAVAYLIVAIAYHPLWALEDKPFVPTMLAFLRLAPFFVPLLILTGAVSVASTDLATRESWYPQHLYTLPLTARQLALPFMTYTVTLYALLYMLAVWISGARVLAAGPLDAPMDALPLQTWDPFLLLALLVWVQALIWLPFRHRWTRIAILFCAVAAYFASLILAMGTLVSISLLVALCVVQIPIAYAVGVRGIARARRGDAWQGGGCGAIRRRARRADARRFRSAVAAQAWFEGKIQRARGKFLLLFVVPLIMLITLLGTLSGLPGSTLAQSAVGMLIFTLVFVGLATGPAAATFDASLQPNKSDAFRMPSFFAALPLATGEFAWVKLKTAAKRMTVLAMVVLTVAVVIAMPTGLYVRWSAVLEPLRVQHGALETGALAVLGAFGFVAATAAGTANLVWISLMGRRWNIAQIVIVFLVIGWLAVALRIGLDSSARAWLSITLAAGAVAKLAALGILIFVVGTRRLYSWSRIGAIGAGWLVALGVCFTVYLRYVASAAVISTTVWSELVLFTPVFGLLAAPLALHFNRCR